MSLAGIHHVSAITKAAPENVQFYVTYLGMRMVKKTVNQDDPSMYHLFYGDEVGNPGTELTFFEIPMMSKNKNGNNSISSIGLRVLNDEALSYWQNRFNELGIEHDDIAERNGQQTLAFRDFEGQRLMLISDERNEGVAGGVPWTNGGIPEAYAIRGLGPIQLTVPYGELTAQVLTDLLGFRKTGEFPSTVAGQRDIVVFETGEGGNGATIHVEERKDLRREHQGQGGVHHVAFRVKDETELHQWIKKIQARDLPNSGFINRYYFRSFYFREPNGILFELATDGPGFDRDEDVAHLGEKLSLPPFLEKKRAAIEANLKPL